MINLKKLVSKDKIFRWIVFLTIIAIPIFSNSTTQQVYFKAVSDAYLQVTVFVALTLFIFYGLESWLKIDTATFLQKHKKYQIPISALLGALPGCGGAIMVITQFTLGRIGFGSVIAVLTSTMGDAAFLLLAQQPDKAAIIFAISFITGTLFGYLVEKIHGYDYLKPKQNTDFNIKNNYISYGFLKTPWVILVIPGLIVGLLTAFQKSALTENLLSGIGISDFNLVLGSIGGLLSLFLWFINPTAGTNDSNCLVCHSTGQLLEKVTADTSFVTTWVITGFLIFELGILWLGFDFESIFNQVQILLPLMAVLVGFLPGCGPQVIVTTLYLQGIIPFSAQIGNAISNDGDALFPALAVAPKASIIATAYTAIPALILSYAYMFLFEKF
jgi:hypothetical protein